VRRVALSLVLLALSFPGVASAQTETPTPDATQQSRPFPDFYALELGLGLVKPQDDDAALGWIARVDLGEVTPNIYFLPGVEYWSNSSTAFGTKVSVHDLTLGGEVRYPFGGTDTRLYVGAGAAVHFLSSKVESGGSETSESRTRLGGDLLAGVQLQASKTVGWFGEAKYRFVSDFGSLRLFGGLRWAP